MDSKLHLVLRLRGGMKFLVKNPNGGTLKSMDVDDSLTVLDLKKKIFEAEGIPLNKQRLLFHGKHLNDKKTLKDYKIQEDSTI